jgi:hypothetical protein
MLYSWFRLTCKILLITLLISQAFMCPTARTEQAFDRDDFQFMRTIAEQVSSKLQALGTLDL